MDNEKVLGVEELPRSIDEWLNFKPKGLGEFVSLLATFNCVARYGDSLINFGLNRYGSFKFNYRVEDHFTTDYITYLTKVDTETCGSNLLPNFRKFTFAIAPNAGYDSSGRYVSFSTSLQKAIDYLSEILKVVGQIKDLSVKDDGAMLYLTTTIDLNCYIKNILARPKYTNNLKGGMYKRGFPEMSSYFNRMFSEDEYIDLLEADLTKEEVNKYTNNLKEQPKKRTRIHL